MFDLKLELEKREWINEDLTFNQKVFFYWIDERSNIWKERNLGKPKPWTDDPIFQQYKFTNVEREKDTVSIWIKENWIDPYSYHPNLWFAMIVARLFNWPMTLGIIDFPKETYGEHIEEWRRKLKHYRSTGAKIFTGAYLVSTNGVKMDKIDYILDRVLTPIWEKGRAPKVITMKDIAKRGHGYEVQVEYALTGSCYAVCESLEDYWKHLIQFDGLGSFMAGQVVADLKFAPPLKDALDWWVWAPLGPGSIRGLNRFFGRDVTKSVKQDVGLAEMRQIQKMVEMELGDLYPVHNLQNGLCEFDKYLRVYYGEGRPRSLYPGAK
jgi:hypothetical protein